MREILICTGLAATEGVVVGWTASVPIGIGLGAAFGLIVGLGLMDARQEARDLRADRDTYARRDEGRAFDRSGYRPGEAS